MVGLGPGGRDQLTFEALGALRSADVIVGYTLYADMVREWLPLSTCESLPLGEEVERARLAIELARSGKRVALVQSGGNAERTLLAEVLADADPELE